MILAQELVSADLAPEVRVPTSQYTSPMTGSFAIWVRTNTPGAGTLLVTVTHDDGTAPADLNLALALTAGNEAKSTYDIPIIGVGSSDIYVSYTYLGAIVDGTADVWIILNE